MRFITNFNCTQEEALALLSESRDCIALDMETVSLDNQLPLGVAIAINADKGFYFFNTHDVLLNVIDATPTILCHNAKFDIPIVRGLGHDVQNYEDTKTLAYTNGIMDTSLKGLSENLLFRDYQSVTSQWRKKDSGNIGIDHIKMGLMSIGHACNTYNLYSTLERLPLYDEIDRPYIDLLMEMEANGLLIDQYELTVVEQETMTEVHGVEKELYEELGQINLASNPQVAAALQLKGVIGTRKTKDHKDSVSDESLRPLKNPIADKILKWRSLMKNITTYVPAFRSIDSGGKIHTNFGYTETGRLTSSRPNLQNITNNGLRRAIVSHFGYTYISLDAEQLELRVVGILSQDPLLLEALATTDLHLATALQVFGFSDDPVIMAKRRYDAKQLNFAILYEAGEYKISEMAGVSLPEAQQLIRAYFSKYIVLDRWIKEQKRQAKEDGYVTTFFNRKRPLPDLTSGSIKVRAKGEREVVNTKVQGTAADIVKMMQLYLKSLIHPDIRNCLQVHDEILLEVPDSLVPGTLTTARDELSLAFPTYPVTIKTGKTYGSLTKVEVSNV